MHYNIFVVAGQIMAELMVVLKRSENLGFGFSLLGISSLPHVIYDIVEFGPAAECGEVEAGDVIVKVNGIDVHRFTTKEVLKCLRLSGDPVTLELKRDPKIKDQIRKYLAQSTNAYHHSELPNLYATDISESQHLISSSSSTSSLKAPSATSRGSGGVVINPSTSGRQIPSSGHRISSSDPITRPSRIPQAIKSPTHSASAAAPKSHSQPQSPHSAKPAIPLTSQIPTSNGSFNNSCSNKEQARTARFEAYMMTGDLILNLSRTPQSSGLIPMQNKKVDSLRDSPTYTKKRKNDSNIKAPRAKYDSSPSSPSLSESSDTGNLINKPKILRDNIVNEHSNLLNLNNPPDNTDDSDFVNIINDDSEFHYNKGCATTKSTSSSSSGNEQEDRDSTDANIRSTILETNLSSERLKNNDSISSSSTVRGDINSSPEFPFSVPTSPTSLTTPYVEGCFSGSGGVAGNRVIVKELSTSVPTSPESGAQEFIRRANQQQQNGSGRTNDAAGFRTSRSEDHLQAQRDGFGAVIPIDIDEDVNSSLNTLLDTRHDSDDSPNSDRDRIVWTYNAPVINQPSANENSSNSSSFNTSPPRSESPASPTSVSSSVMSSNSSSKGNSHSNNGFHNPGMHNLVCPVNGDQSVSEAVSNISSPDYQDDDNLLSTRDMAMAISDPSDSDSTILVSEAPQNLTDKDHRVVLHLKNNDSNLSHTLGYMELKNFDEDEIATLTDDTPTIVLNQDGRDSSPPISEDGSDVDSLHSYHYSPKAVDIPSAVRLAKRLYGLEGFKKSDVSRHLSKNNDFSRAVAEEYLKYFRFENISLDDALRQFLQQFSLSGETQERERVLVHFSKRFLDCNPNCFNSQDAVHTLTCAIMLLNTDLHGQNIGRRMTCSEFIENLADLNDGENFPKDILKYLYQAIKSNPLQWALDEDYPVARNKGADNNLQGPPAGQNPFLEVPQNPAAVEYKKGYVMRKCCFDSNNKKTPFGKRSWKMFYCTLRDLVLYLHKDEHGFRKNQMSDNVHNAIRIHHALATKALDYTKKQHVFRLQTADQAEYLFQTSDSKELQSWIDTINFVCACFSAPPLEGGVGSQKRFQRPLLPSTHTKLLLREQLDSHEQRVTDLTVEFDKHRHLSIPSKGLALQNFKEKDAYLQYELKRYKSYVNVLKSKLDGDELNNYFDYMRKPNSEGMLQAPPRNNPNTLSQIQGSTTCEEADSAGALLNELNSSGEDQLPSLNRQPSSRSQPRNRKTSNCCW